MSHMTMQEWLSLDVLVAMAVDLGISRMKRLATASAQSWTGLPPAAAICPKNEEAEKPSFEMKTMQNHNLNLETWLISP